MPTNFPSPQDELNPYAPPRNLPTEESPLDFGYVQQDLSATPTTLPVFRFWTIVGLGALLLCGGLLSILIASQGQFVLFFLLFFCVFFTVLIGLGAYKSQQRKLQKFAQEYPDYNLSASDIQKRCWLFLLCIVGMAIAEFVLLVLVCVAACFGYFWVFNPRGGW